jgi:DNA primase
MPGFIPESTLDQIRAASDIVEVIQSYIGPLKKAGANFTALCPFHREKTPSFNVTPSKQMFYCYGCHKGGDVFKFVREYENIGFVDAVRRLADRARIPLEFEQTPGAQQQRHIKDVLLQLHEQLTQRWHAALLNDAAGQIARDYLARRGVSDEAVKLFRLGFAPDKWDDTVNWSRGKGYDAALVEQGGLILKREGADGYYDRFRGRLMFPICDEQGRVIGFSGRVLAGDEKTAKYVNSPETPIFTKGRVIFGLDKSRRALSEKDCAIICEGQLDLIAIYMAGVQNVVAPQGTALTAEHARILKRHVDEVVLCFDADNAGQNATVRALDAMLAEGLAVRVASVPAPHDPDSFIKAHGGLAFADLIARAQGFFDYYLDRLCATNDVRTDKGRNAVVRSMAEAAGKANDRVTLERCAQNTAGRLGVAPASVLAEFRKAPATKPVAREEEPPLEPAGPERPRPDAREFWLLRLVLLHDDLAPFAAAHLDPAWLGNDDARALLTARLAAERESNWRGLPALLDALGDDGARVLAAEAVAESPGRIPNPEQQLLDVLVKVRNAALDRQIAELGRQMADPAASEARQLELLGAQQALRHKKLAALRPHGR